MVKLPAMPCIYYELEISWKNFLVSYNIALTQEIHENLIQDIAN